MVLPPKGLLAARTGIGGPSVSGGTGSILEGLQGLQPSAPGLLGQNVPAPPGQQQGLPTPNPMGPVPAAPPSVPGVSGVTPGAIERRLGGQAGIPPTLQANPTGAALSPTSQAQMQLGNTVGAAPQGIRTPIELIRQLLQGGGVQ